MMNIRLEIEALGQPQLLEGFDSLSSDEKEAFIEEIRLYSPLLPLDLPSVQAVDIEPLPIVDLAGLEEDDHAGRKLIQQGKVACVILAGGQGSRMALKGPKGMVSVPEMGKTLFQVFAEKTRQASHEAGVPLHLAIMTSPLNDLQTRAYFEENRYFDLPRTHVHLFTQSMRPLLDANNHWILERPGKLALGPDGNGYALHALHHSGILSEWMKQGVEYVSVILVDNPLADPFDPIEVGYQWRKGVEVVVKSVPKISPEEKMGTLVQHQGKVCVIEYSEMTLANIQLKTPSGTPAYALGNTSLFSFRMDFIQRMVSDTQVKLPWHMAHKQVDTFKGKVEVQKQEAFIFDLLPYAHSTGVLLYPREQIFAPIKV